MKELIETYEAYIKLLTQSEANMIGLAYAHGFVTPPSIVQKGKELREKIVLLKKQNMVTT